MTRYFPVVLVCLSAFLLISADDKKPHNAKAKNETQKHPTSTVTYLFVNDTNGTSDGDMLTLPIFIPIIVISLVSSLCTVLLFWHVRRMRSRPTYTEDQELQHRLIRRKKKSEESWAKRAADAFNLRFKYRAGVYEQMSTTAL